MQPSKNHHGYIVTTPTGSVSLRDLPVPVHETKEKAGRFAKQQGIARFLIVPAAQFYRTQFGQSVQRLTAKRILKQRELEAIPKEQTGYKHTGLTNLLNAWKAKQQARRLAAKIKADTPKPATPAQVTARQMRDVGRELDTSRSTLADKSYLLQAMVAPKNTKLHSASDYDLGMLYAAQDNATRLEIDRATKFRWTRKRINKLVKSNTIKNILILFRAGKMPESVRTRKILLLAINR